MNFDEELRSTSVRDQSAAALFLRAEGKNAEKHLPKLLERCRAIDLTANELDRFQIALLGLGAMTLGDCIRQIGFDTNSSFHIDAMHFIIELTQCKNTEVAAYAINGLGCLGSAHPDAIGCLKDIALSQKRTDDHGIVTCRAIAFRMLAQIDRSLAAPFRDSLACQEYLNAVDRWLQTESSGVQQQLVEESKWLR